MFTENIDVTMLNDSIADKYFERKIIARKYFNHGGGRDNSLLVTARALIEPRIKENQMLNVWGKLYNDIYNESDAQYAITNITDYHNDLLCIGDIEERAGFYIILTYGNSVEYFKTVFERMEGWKEQEKVRVFYEPYFACCAYINEEKKASIIVARAPRNYDGVMKTYHAVQCALLTAQPWFFNPETDKKQVTERDLALLEAIASGNYHRYMELIDEYADALNFRDAAIAKILESFETSLETGRLSNLNSQINNAENRIEDLMRDLESIVKQKREMLLQRQAVQLGIDEKQGKFTVRDFFANAKNYKFIDIRNNGSEFDFIINTYLNSWDEDAKNNAIHNHRSVMYQYIDDQFWSDAELLYTAIFDTKEIKVPMSATFRMYSSGSPVAAVSDHAYLIDKEHMPNPHLENYSCLGDYRGDIADAMLKNDYAYALEIAGASTGNVSFEDNTVMQRWTEWIFHRNCEDRKCFELPSGEHVTLSETLSWLRDKEKEKEASETVTEGGASNE